LEKANSGPENCQQLFHENCRFFKVFGITKTGTSLILIFSKNQNDETLPIINKPKHPKKGGMQGTKWKDPCPKRHKNHLRG
jgi:hypothetical protein